MSCTAWPDSSSLAAALSSLVAAFVETTCETCWMPLFTFSMACACSPDACAMELTRSAAAVIWEAISLSASAVSLAIFVPASTFFFEPSISAVVSLAAFDDLAARFRTSSRRQQTLAVLTGARRLYGCVERQDICLKRDIINHFDDFADVGRGFIDLIHGAEHTFHVLIAGRGVQFGFWASSFAFSGVFSHSIRLRGNLHQFGGQLLDGTRLLGRALKSA